MIKAGHLKRTQIARSGIACAAAVALLFLLAVPAQALVVIMDIGWGYYGTGLDNTTLGSTYALQEGSIVQIIAYDSTAADPNNQPPGPNANNNFDLFGSYAGPALPGQPNVSPNTNAPTENNVYDPESVPDGHVIAYTTEIGPAIGGNANNTNWYNIYASFQILDSYDSIYIRVFGATEFPHSGVPFASYWGISAVQTDGGSIGTWYVTYDDVTAENHVNYFEVIPEPGSLGLFALGGVGLWAARRRRPKRD